MDVALQSSVWVTSPEFAGYLQKRGFHVSIILMVTLSTIYVVYCDCVPAYVCCIAS